MRQYLTKISSFTFKTNRVLSFGKVSLIITKISPSFAKGAAFVGSNHEIIIIWL